MCSLFLLVLYRMMIYVISVCIGYLFIYEWLEILINIYYMIIYWNKLVGLKYNLN